MNKRVAGLPEATISPRTESFNHRIEARSVAARSPRRQIKAVFLLLAAFDWRELGNG
ncbi:hypothetical protein GCM10028822_14110 [Hymenobacter terrigena]